MPYAMKSALYFAYSTLAMMFSLRKGIVILLLSLVIIASNAYPRSFAAMPNPYLPLPSSVDHSMTVRIAISGISDIDKDKLLWSLESDIRPAIQVSANPQLTSETSGISFGTNFQVKYEIISVPKDATNAFKEYLKSIARTEKVPKYLQGYGYWSSASDSGNYATLDALKTEEWVNSHVSEFGGIPDDGYTIIVADVSDISNLHHYYNVSYNSLDKATTRAKYHNRPEIYPIVDWMFSWGGHQRFYYLDLSGGDAKYDYSQVGHVPIQEFGTKYYSDEQVKFKRNVNTVTEYVADYVAEAVRNLFLPSYVYAPTFAKSYKIVINVFDQTGKISPDEIGDYLSTDLVKKAFEAVIPYATWDVSISAHRLSDDNALEDTLSQSILFSRDVTGTFGDKVHIDYYDYRPVYSYLQSHLGQYADSSGDSVVLPAFEFVFKDGGRFAITWEEGIGSGARGPDWPGRTFGGVSLGDMAIIGYNERNVFAFGYELSEVTIHELGHTIGLMHPHSYGSTEDYVSSAMSYMTYEYGFSQFDADAVQRAHADFFISQIQGAMQASAGVTFQSSEAQGLLQQARSAYDEALNSYSKKDYQLATVTLQSMSGLLNQAFDLEVNGIQEKISKTSATSETGRQLIQRANDLVNSAKSQRDAGNLGVAYQLLTEASRSTEQALQVESQAQEATRVIAAQFQTALMIGLGIGVVVGIAAGFMVANVLKRKKA